MRILAALSLASSLVFCAPFTSGEASAQPSPAPQAPASPPSFRTGVEVVTVDVQAVDDKGNPVEGLTADDFTLNVDGKPRPISSARFVRYVESGTPGVEGAATAAAAAVPDRGFGTNEGLSTGRLIVIVVDQGNMTRGVGRAAMEAAVRFVNRLTPADRVGLVTIPVGPTVDFTNDFERVTQALRTVIGGSAPQISGYRNVSLAEAFSFTTGQQRRLWTEAVQLECSSARNQNEYLECVREMETNAREKVMTAKSSASTSLQALRNILRRLATIDGPKQLVLIGQTLVTGTSFGDLDMMADVNEVGTLAQRGRVTVSVLHMDRAFLEAFDVRERSPTRTLIEDSHLLNDGLVETAGAAGGAYYNLTVALDPGFDRIARETSAAYEIGFETIEADRDGKPHKISVKVQRPKVTVRARRSFVAGRPAATATGTPADATSAPAPNRNDLVARILESPIPRTALPVRLRAHALGEPGGSRVRVLLVADIGRNISEPAEVAVGYFLRIPGGDVAGRAIETLELQPSGHGSLYYTTVLLVPPGEYLLRLAAVSESDRAGMVETPVTARFEAAAGYELSDPLLIEPDVRAGDKIKMNVDGRVSGRELTAYVELRRAADAVSPATPGAGVAPAAVTTARPDADAPVPPALDPSAPIPTAPAAPAGEASPGTAATPPPSDPPASPAAAPMVRFDLIDPSGGAVLTGRQVQSTAESDPGRWFAEATLDIAAVPAGRYTLRVAPVDPDTSEAAPGMVRAVQVVR